MKILRTCARKDGCRDEFIEIYSNAGYISYVDNVCVCTRYSTRNGVFSVLGMVCMVNCLRVRWQRMRLERIKKWRI